MENFALNIYNIVVSMIGELPMHLHFVYGFATIIVVSFIVMFAFSPWIILYRFIDRW